MFLERKIQLCEELLVIADILEPGYSRFKGNLLYDLHAAMVAQANRKYDNQLITKQEFWVLLKNGKFCLSIKCGLILGNPTFCSQHFKQRS